ncbi:unnamed protein product, partial [Orchesella dallaii]
YKDTFVVIIEGDKFVIKFVNYLNSTNVTFNVKEIVCSLLKGHKMQHLLFYAFSSNMNHMRRIPLF